MRVDQWFGSAADEAAYQETSGSHRARIAVRRVRRLSAATAFPGGHAAAAAQPALSAFIGRVNRDEYVTERRPGSGAFARQYGPVQDDETLFGIRYRSPKQGGRFQADAGLRLRSPLDPFVKGSWRFEHGSSESTLFSLRETAFWQNSEKFGVTSRADVERVVADHWLLRGTLSGTISQRTEGVSGYTAFTAIRGLPDRRAICGRVVHRR